MIIQRKLFEPLMNWRLWLPPAFASVLLIALAQYSYLGFHTVAELFAIVISFLIFTFAWTTRGFSRNDFLLFLACGYLWIGSLDLIHTLVYKGMDVFGETSSGNLSTQYWLGARYSEALLLLAAPFAAARKQNGYLLVAGFGAVAVGLVALIVSGRFPVSFVDGVGLTDFKIYSEYAIDVILALALVCLFRYGRNIETSEKMLIGTAIVLTMCAELAFTFYVDVYGISNLVGHILKLFSFWLIFHAIVVSNLIKPYAALQKSEGQSRSLFDDAEVSMWNGDFLEINNALNRLRQDGVTDLRHYFEHNEHAMPNIARMLKILQVNQATLTLFGAKDKEEFLSDVNQIFGPSSSRVLYKVLYALWDRQKIFRSEASLRTLNREPIEAIVSFHIPETDEGFRSIPVSIVDISDRKKAEEEMLAAKREAEIANQAKSEFLESMSHELRTPLNVILEYSQVLRSSMGDNLSDGQNRQFGQIRKAGNQLLNLVNQILDLSRIDSNKIEVLLRDINARDVVSECVDLVTLSGNSQGLTIINNFDVDPELCVFADKPRLIQVLINLLSNAVKYNKEGGFVTVAGKETDDGFLHLSVTDTGIGISEKDQARIFQMFERLGTDAAASSPGVGIGLAVAKLLVENMGGRIGFESQLGVGTTFWFEIPLSTNEEAINQSRVS